MPLSDAHREILARFPGQRVLAVGDLILDRYWWGDASRLSPEAPVPVVRRRRSSVRPGGAANAAANLAALGAAVQLFGVVGDDNEADELRAAVAEFGISYRLVVDAGRPTTTKTRVIAAHQQIARVDDESDAAVPDEIVEATLGRFADAIPGSVAVVVSDYAKGFVTARLIRGVLETARSAGVPSFIDPKAAGVERYSGATLLKPNRLELGLLARMPARDHDETVAAGRRLSRDLPGTCVLVTEGADGMSLFSGGELLEWVRSTPRQVFDVTGAGDTVLATVAMAVAAGANWRAAMELAAEAAAIAIGMVGTTAVSLDQLRGRTG